MLFEIRGRSIRVTEALRGHIQRRLRFALERFTMQIRRVRVSVSDLNGPRGGIDKRCQLAISLVPAATIVMEGRDSNIYAAVDRVADKAGRSIGRRLKRPHGSGPSKRISELLS